MQQGIAKRKEYRVSKYMANKQTNFRTYSNCFVSVFYNKFIQNSNHFKTKINIFFLQKNLNLSRILSKLSKA